jgi:hypothetical protein
VALRTYTSLFLYDAESFLSGGTKGGDPGTVYPLPLQQQGESLAYNDDGSAVVVGSEGINQPLYQVTLPKQGNQSVAGAASDSSGKSLAIGIAVIVLVGIVAGLITRRRSGGAPDVREDQASSPTT